MFKKFLIIFLGVWAVWGFWNFILPDAQRNQALALVSDTLGWKKMTIRNILGTRILPENKEKAREALLKELKSNLENIKATTNARQKSGNVVLYNSPASFSSTSSASSSNQANLINRSEEIIAQLENNNQDNSVLSQATNKVLDAVLPGGNNCAK